MYSPLTFPCSLFSRELTIYVWVAGHCLFVDAEHALDMQFAEGIGVTTKNLLFNQPDYAEQALDTVDHFVRSTGVDVIVVDSVIPDFPDSVPPNEIAIFAHLSALVTSVDLCLANKCMTVDKILVVVYASTDRNSWVIR